MITIRNKANLKPVYDIEQKFPEKSICYFDIETTGLSRMKNSVYLIGIVYKENNEFTAVQWMDDDGHSEEEMIKAFIETADKFDVIINYNGNSFDVPFIAAKAEKYNIFFNTQRFISYDIYREIHKYKNFFGLCNLKQKSIELFLNICRDDKYDGGKLIEVYYNYLKNHSEQLKHLLLLHNYDDICGLVSVCDIFSYLDIAEGKYIVTDIKLTDNLIIECTLKNRLKVPFSMRCDSFYLSCGGDKLRMLIPVEKNEMKYYYTDYKNYFYLPDEDMAIHKSVAQFVDKEHKIKACKSNCYTKKTGLFSRQYAKVINPVFMNDINSKEYYFEADKLTDKNIIYLFIRDIIKNMVKKH